jgi:threonine synthase
MQYYSTNNPIASASLKDAVFRGLAPDGGLFMPERIPMLSCEFYAKLADMDFRQLSLEISEALFGEDIEKDELKKLVYDALNFETPLKRISDNISVLELYHGPTLAFKDVGARFMARMLSVLVKDYPDDIHVLVATSGDTGSAVANGFLGVEGIKVHVLYPRNKVSKIQEIQFTTLGENITALEVDGSFDDCQRLVKEAFNDQGLRKKLTLTSANSINLARLLPQAYYYFNAFRQMDKKTKPVFCVPSGNFGNLTAGLIAWNMGLPVEHFITATNVNDVVPEYLKSGKFNSRPSISTLANAMDVGDPSNFARMLDLFEHSHEKMNSVLSGYSYTNEQIREGIRRCLKEHDYLLDPHGSTAYMAATDYLKEHPDEEIIILETAHPSKFRETVEETTGIPVNIPPGLEKFFKLEKKSLPLGRNYEDLRGYLLGDL